jgi:hypothetical protein
MGTADARPRPVTFCLAPLAAIGMNARTARPHGDWSSGLEEGVEVKAVVRSIILAGVLGLLPVASAQAACGIGTQLWEGSNSTATKILASITNFWTLKAISTTFEIAGCTSANNWFANASDARVEQFASQNLDHLATDMARGRGEHLDALGQLISLRQTDRGEFRALTQSHFEELFPNDHASVLEMLGTLKELMAESSALSSYVKS